MTAQGLAMRACAMLHIEPFKAWPGLEGWQREMAIAHVLVMMHEEERKLELMLRMER